MSAKRDDKQPLVLGSNMERDKAVAQMGRELDRQQPATERFDFWSLVPEESLRDQLPTKRQFEAEQNRRDRLKRLADSGIVPTLLEEDVEMVVNDALPIRTASLANVQGWINKRSTLSYSFSTLVLVGLKGQGKTLAGAWLIAEKGPGVYCTAEELRASFKGYTAQDRALWIRAKRALVLVVDELGRETDVPSADAMMFELVNARRGRAGQSGQLWSLYLSNLVEAQFKARYDEITIDRIEQAGGIFTVNTPNLRERAVDRQTQAFENASRGRAPRQLGDGNDDGNDRGNT